MKKDTALDPDVLVMTATPIRQSRTRPAAAKLRIAASSVAPVAAGYDRSLRPCAACFSPAASTISTDGDR